MSKKYGLGKGLGALFPDDNVESVSGSILIDINLIKANKDQPRKSFDEDKISSLSLSIVEHGIIQPLILVKEDDYYSIVAGERRWRAAKRAGIKEVPAVIMNISNRDILEISLIENVQREDLNPIEEAFAYSKLIQEFSLTQEELSKTIGKSRTAIANCMRLLNLDVRVKDYLIDNVISEGHGRALLGIEDMDVQYLVSQKVIDEGLNVRQTEDIVRGIAKGNLKDKVKEKVVWEYNQYYDDIESKLESYLGTKVNINGKKNKHKIEIEFYSDDDLQRIIEILKI